MEEYFKDLLHFHHNKFAALDVETLIPPLRESNVLSSEDVEEIRRQTNPPQKVLALIDILPNRGPQAFQTLFIALETISPHLLTLMIIGAPHKTGFSASRPGSISAGLTSDSECDEKRSSSSSVAMAEVGVGSGGRPVSSSSSPQPQGCLVSSHDYNMEQSNVKLLKAELKIVTKDRDVMKKELKKALKDREEAIKLFAASSQHIDQQSSPSYGTITKHGSSPVNENSSRDVDALNIKYEKSLIDLQVLKKQNIEMSRKFESTVKDVDYYRKQERAAFSSIQNLRLQYDEMAAEKRKLENEVSSLQKMMEEDRKEIVELRRQQEESMSHEDSEEAMNQLYVTTFRKYDALKDEYDAFRKRYSDLAASHSSNISKLELAQEEISRLKKQYEEVVREKNCLKQQCTEAIRQWDTALRDKNKLQEELLKLRERNEVLLKEMNTHMIQGQTLGKEYKRLQSERNAAMREYTLVMSERDTVHKEMDKLQEELNIASKKIKAIEQCTFDSSKERDSLQLQLETLKREIASSLHDRDKAIRECNELRERFGTPDDASKEWDTAFKDYDTLKQERELKMKEVGDMVSSSHEMYAKAQKERLENLDQANQEIDRLRKNVEKLQSDLEEAKREAEVSKRRRDWAFSERDKIVLERESIRAHCDKLRHERDRAVSDLAEALRDSDDMMKQRNEAAKELKELKEKLETERDKTIALRHAVVGRNTSRDSAIDTDMHEWEIESMQLQVGVLSSERDLGFEVCGGAEDPHYGGSDGAVYVSSISKQSPFDGKLRLHDQVIRINGIECQGSSPANIYSAILKCGGWVQLTVRRRRVGARCLYTIHIHCPSSAHHGLILQTGVYIANILAGSPAAREGNLAVGDRVLNINGRPVESSVPCESIQALLNSSGDTLQLTTLKSLGSSSMSVPLSSSSSGHNMTEDDKMAAVASSSPSKEGFSSVVHSGLTGRTSKDLGLKLRTEEKRLGSSERVVYNVTKPHEEKVSSGGPWGQIKNIVRPRRHSKERGDGRSESREKEDHKKKEREERERESAIAQLDSVIDSYKYKGNPNTSTTKRSKKKDKESSGGTWPKYRGGGVITLSDINMGTVKHSIPRKERPPLSMYIPSLSNTKYPSADNAKGYGNFMGKKHDSSVNSNARNSMFDPRPAVSSPRSHIFSVLKTTENPDTHSFSISDPYVSPRSLVYSGPPLYSRIGSPDHHKEGIEKEARDTHGSPDTSLDFSVRSGNVGKEELEYYVKKNLGGGGIKYPPSDSEGSSLHLQPSSLPPVYMSRPSPLHHVGERIPSNSRISHPHSGLYSPPTAALRVSPFAPYAPLSFHQHSHTHTVANALHSFSSPIYSTPPLPILGGSPHFMSPSRSGDSILSSPGPDRDPRDIRNFYESQIASSPTGSYFHSASPSLDVGCALPKRTPHLHHPHGIRASSDEPPPHVLSGPPSYYDYQRAVATMPRKREDERVRIPSNSSISTTKSCRSTGGLIDHESDRGESGHLERASPMSSSFPVTQISHSIHNQHLVFTLHKKAQPGDIRNIYIEKDSEPLGIQIRCLGNGGVFVASVTIASIAEKVGLSVGDQLLEVCGINMRSATKQLASTVLSQCGNQVTILVQFNPDKYHESEGWDESSSGGSLVMGSRSVTPTPHNSPKASRDSPIGGEEDEEDDDLPPSSSSTLRAPIDPRELESSLPHSARSTLTRPQAAHVLGVLKRQDTLSRRSSSKSSNASGGETQSPSTGPSDVPKSSPNHAPPVNATDARRIRIQMTVSHNLGVQMVGGNALGIFVHSVSPESPAAQSDLRVGDRILEYNGVDLRHATAEQAACELSKPADNINMLVQWNYQTYSEIKDQPGDSFYVRALFSKYEQADSVELMFRKGDILYVDNTLFKNVLGQWRAWLVNEDGHKRIWGTVPSKDKVEEEMMSQRPAGEVPIDSSRRGSTTARRSFFRRKKHSRSSSRDSKELASFSDASLNAYAEAPPAQDEPPAPPLSYMRVERLDYLVRRPVVLVGPLWELVCEKLLHDFPHKFFRCAPDISNRSQTDLEAAVQAGAVVDYRRRGNQFETTFVSQVKDICDKNCHGILDISLGSVVRLHRHNIYPIVLVLKFKHHKHIRDISDAHFAACERLSQKEAKEMFDITNKIDQDYKHLVSAEITAGANMSYICAQVKALVDTEQSKTLWVPSESVYH